MTTLSSTNTQPHRFNVLVQMTHLLRQSLAWRSFGFLTIAGLTAALTTRTPEAYALGFASVALLVAAAAISAKAARVEVGK